MFTKKYTIKGQIATSNYIGEVTEVNVWSLALCEGRHEFTDTATDGSIFKKWVNRNAPVSLEADALKSLESKGVKAGDELRIYVTGLTIAFVAAANAAKKLGVSKITCYHYNRVTNSFFTQEVR